MIGHVVDITTEGMMLIGEKKLPLERDFELEIRFQRPSDNSDQVIPFRARSMWASPDVNANFTDTGMQLLDDAEEVLKPIRELIHQYGFQD